MVRQVFQHDHLSEAEWQVVQADLFRRAGTSYDQLAGKTEEGLRSGYDVAFQLKTIGQLLAAGQVSAL